jgi:hypothetical protein
MDARVICRGISEPTDVLRDTVALKATNGVSLPD